jgi:single-stranded-DNA-specific exonuclease
MKRWVISPYVADDSMELYQMLKIHPVLCHLLLQRDVHTYEEAKKFFRPSLTDLHDPFLMRDMDKAVYRIQQAILKKEKILIYGDYDVDGTTSVALVFSYLKNKYPLVDFYIPNRYTEGYGISYKAIDWANENGFSLVIALDCGIKENAKIIYGNNKNVDFIICDHHLPGAEVPPAFAVLDPQRSDCNYPYKQLSGCAIGFKLVQALEQTEGRGVENIQSYLDLVAVSISADIVPITGENRVLAFFGLKKLNENPRPGFKALIDLSAVRKDITVTDVVFMIGPRINSAGRMDDARKAVTLLLSENADHAFNNAEILSQTNTQRREFDANITEEALKMIRSNPDLENKRSTVLFQPNWHKGVIGIVASRLIENYYRPTIILCQSGDGIVAGSARSVEGYDVYAAITLCADLLEQYGGHKYAAGLTMKEENVNAFIKRFEEVVSSTIEESMLMPEIKIDAELGLEDINQNFFGILKQFAPFGPGNMKPVFTTQSVRNAGHSRIVGENHLKISIRKNSSPITFGIGFGMANFLSQVENNEFDICYNLEESEWNGNRRIEMIVKDIR